MNDCSQSAGLPSGAPLPRHFITKACSWKAKTLRDHPDVHGFCRKNVKPLALLQTCSNVDFDLKS
eukprot:5262536-Amphidinium_carterae.1